MSAVAPGAVARFGDRCCCLASPLLGEYAADLWDRWADWALTEATSGANKRAFGPARLVRRDRGEKHRTASQKGW